MATLYNAFARIHSLPPANRMPGGSIAQVVTSVAHHLRQPQYRVAAPRAAAFFALPKEPEDALITGGTRSLDRRLLALNLSGSLSKAAASRNMRLAS